MEQGGRWQKKGEAAEILVKGVRLCAGLCPEGHLVLARTPGIGPLSLSEALHKKIGALP